MELFNSTIEGVYLDDHISFTCNCHFNNNDMSSSNIFVMIRIFSFKQDLLEFKMKIGLLGRKIFRHSGLSPVNDNDKIKVYSEL